MSEYTMTVTRWSDVALSLTRVNDIICTTTLNPVITHVSSNTLRHTEYVALDSSTGVDSTLAMREISVMLTLRANRN